MFKRRLTELQQRQLAMRLRNIEIRTELRAELQHLQRPLGWLGLAGSAASVALLLGALRKPGRLLRALGLARLGLRVLRLLKSAFSA